MKILKLLNSFIISLSILFPIYLSSLSANEPVDIWEIKDEEKDNNKIVASDTTDENEYGTDENSNQPKNNSFNQEKLELPKVSLIGLYDPEENNLALDMWLNSDGDQIKSIMKNIDAIKLSKDAIEILKIALLTNSYIPQDQIDSDTFIKYKTNFLKKNKDLDLIKDFLIKNKDLKLNNELIKYYTDEYLLENNLKKSCSLFDEVDLIFNNDYLDKFKIYCLISQKKFEDAQLYYDLKVESGFKDIFFEQNFKFMLGYSDKTKNISSEKSVLDFHLMHINNEEFFYKPNENTPKFIWRYLSNYNLLEQISEIDLEDVENILTIERATNENNYEEIELLNLYKRFQFTLDDYLNVKNKYSKLPNYKSRALLYQRMLLTYDIEEKLFLLEKLKKSMQKDLIGNSFNIELSNILKQIDAEDVPSQYSTFYEKNIIPVGLPSKKIKFNNKIVHQSKLLNYFIKKQTLEKVSKDTNDLLKKIKANKKYVFSNKDKMLLDSIVFDGARIQKKFNNLYERDPNIPTDLQVLINNDDIGMILLRLVEIIGADKIEDLGTETQYFIISVLNQINLDKVRNSILLEILPLRA